MPALGAIALRYDIAKRVDIERAGTWEACSR
jgi:hypothetical protein